MESLRSRIAISAIAWPLEDDEAVAKEMQKQGITRLEFAPTRLWPDLLTTTQEACLAQKGFWNSYGIQPVAMQSLLFGRPDLIVFGTDTQREELLAYLTQAFRIAAWLGITSLVFGSPKNRQRGMLSSEVAERIAIPFFREVAHVADAYGVVFCIEPNPSVYGCDFVLNTQEAIAFVKAVDVPEGFRLHLDLGASLINQEDPSLILEATPLLQHVHVSAPGLAPIYERDLPYGPYLAMLKQVEYGGTLSIEMRAVADGRSRIHVGQALQYLSTLLTFLDE